MIFLNTKKFNIFVSWSFQYASEVTVDEILAQNTYPYTYANFIF